MNKTLRLLSFTLLLTSSFCSKASLPEVEQFEASDSEFLQGAIASTDMHMQAISDEFNLPSLSIAILVDGHIRYQKAIGYADLVSEKAASPDTQYSVGSVAKSMTGIALMRLVQQGKAQITAPLNQYNASVDGKYSGILLQQLASHTAGIKHDTPERDVLEFKNVRDHQSPEEAYITFNKHPLLFEPGEGFKYSSNGYIFLSGMIATLAGEPFDVFMQKQVFAPLNMHNTRLDNSINSDIREANYYESWQESTGFKASTAERDRSFLFGAGGYMSTPTDLVQMSTALFNDSYLAPEFVEQMLTPVKLNSGEDNEERYAIGWRVRELPLNEQEKVRVVHHGGVTDKAATAYLLVVPEKKSAIAFATNMVPPKFWRMRGKAARILMHWLNKDFRGAAK